MRTKNHALAVFSLLLVFAAAGATLLGSVAEPPPRNWLERLSRDDRAALDAIIDQPLPEFTKDLRLIADEPLARRDLNGKVVVIQSWSSALAAGRRAPQELVRHLRAVDSEDLVLLALHTPDGATRVDDYLRRSPVEMPILVDPTGEYCDAIGVYKRPVNIVVDKHGVVRYAGLNPRGLRSAVTELLAEDYDSERVVEPSQAGAAAYPPHNQGRLSADKDLQGQAGPRIAVEQWMNGAVDTQDKVIVLEFWATWCPPCRAAIPHLNELATTFGDRVAIIGVTSEKLDDFREGLEKHELDLNEFRYAVAIDTQARAYRFVGVRGIPHTVVMSSEGMVRWQGHPSGLSEETLEAIVRADEAARRGQARSGRWVRE